MVILGQDPYHDDGQAMGLSFSVRAGGRCRPSLQNIFKELGTDLGCTKPTHGDLDKWATQGVLMLNAIAHCPRAPGELALEKGVGRRSRTPLSARWPRTAPASCSYCGAKTRRKRNG